MTLPNDETPILVDAESRQNSSQNGAIAQDDIRTAKQVRAGRVQLVALCASLFLHGWTNGVVGPLIPSIQKSHQLSYPKVSLVFVLQNVGSVCCSLGSIVVASWWRFGSIYVAGSLLSVIGAALQAAAPVTPFSVFLIGNFLSGLGLAMLTTTSTSYIASFRYGPKTKQGFVQACFGLGALVAPLAATRFAQRSTWAYGYLIAVGLAVVNSISLCSLFRRRTQEDCLAGIGQLRAGPLIEKPAEELPPHGNGRSVRVTARAAISLPAVHYIAGFVFICVGVEVMTAGWIVTYMIEVRGGGPSSGYVASGFWAGLMAGRVVLLPVNKRLGEVSAIYAYTITLVGLEFIIWLVPNLYASAIAASLAGLLIGPMFPIAISQAARILPSELLDASIAWASAICGAGAAVLPLISGAIAGRFGFKSVQPFTIATLGVMLVVWSLVPRRPIVR